MRTLIYLGGEKPSPELSRKASSRADYIIAADSGYLPALDHGVVPNVVTGDFDSIGSPPSDESIEIVPAPEQDATDFEKALRLVPDNTAILEILGGTGLRSDHFLTNLLIAAGCPPNQRVVFEDDTQTIYRVTRDCPLDEDMLPESVISLIPFSACPGVTTSGLHWDLDNSSMGPGEQLGQSNRVDTPSVSIQVESGTLYVVLNNR